MWSEFKAFLIKQNALALAIGVVIGAALNGVVDAIVKGLITPIIAAASGMTGQGWQTWKTPGPVAFEVGLIVSAILNFLIVGFVAWRMAKLFIRESPPAPAAPQAALRSCPSCIMEIDARATKCPHCTSAIAAVSV